QAEPTEAAGSSAASSAGSAAASAGSAAATGGSSAGGSLRRLVRDELRRIVPGGIDPHTPFYQAGLGSLGLTRLHGALQTALGREFPLTELFSHPTEVELSAHLSQLTG